MYGTFMGGTPMCLDLQQILDGWNRTARERCARFLRAEDGSDLVQLRIDLGLLQMHADGRPDGSRDATLLDRASRALDAGQDIGEEEWERLHRELQQFNYRRIALMELAGAEDDVGAAEDAEPWLQRALRDTQHCLRILQLESRHDRGRSENVSLLPTLILNRTRLLARIESLQNRPEQAVDAIEDGLEALRELMREAGCSEEQCRDDPTLNYLVQLSRRIRRRFHVRRTLREQLTDAVQREDYETAARLRDELNRRPNADSPQVEP
jgi:hypothetical protein